MNCPHTITDKTEAALALRSAADFLRNNGESEGPFYAVMGIDAYMSLLQAGKNRSTIKRFRRLWL